MNALRWTLLSVLALSALGFVALAIIGDGFRRSFGASGINPFVMLLPLAAGGGLLAALLWPESRTLLHVGAGVALACIGLCLWQLSRESAAVLWWVLGYLVAWLGFYGSALRQGTS